MGTIMGRPILLWLVALALVVLFAGCSSSSLSEPGREGGLGAVQIDASQAAIEASENQSGAASEERGGRLRMVKFTIPTIT